MVEIHQLLFQEITIQHQVRTIEVQLHLATQEPHPKLPYHLYLVAPQAFIGYNQQAHAQFVHKVMLVQTLNLSLQFLVHLDFIRREPD